MNLQEISTYEFGPYRLNAAEGLLLRGGKTIPLTPKVFETLVVLVRNAGHLLTKEELMQALWPDTFVEEGNLKANISTLRKALGEPAEGLEYIETVPRRGYRFAAEVHVSPRNGVPVVQPGAAPVVMERHTLERTVTEEEIVTTREEPVPAAPAAPAAVLPAGRPRQWGVAAGIAALSLMVVVLVAVRALRAPKAGPAGAVVRVSYMGGRLQAWDEENQLAWSYQFEEPIEEPRTTNHSVLFADLAGDGTRQMVVVVGLQKSGGIYSPINRVACFSPRGELLWSYHPQMSLSFGGREYQGPWLVRDVMVSVDPQHRGVWVAYSHHTWWPSFVVRINAQGLAEMRFVNSGHITILDSVKNDRGTFVLAGGLNNEYGGAAALAILREDQTMAASPQSPGTPFWCDQCTEDRPFRYYVFPRSELNRLEGQGYNPFHVIYSASSQIRLVTTELPGSSTFVYGGVYALNARMELAEAGYSEAYWTRHDQLHREGRLDHPAQDCPEKRHIAVRMWDPEKGWQEPAVGVAGAK